MAAGHTSVFSMWGHHVCVDLQHSGIQVKPLQVTNIWYKWKQTTAHRKAQPHTQPLDWELIPFCTIEHLCGLCLAQMGIDQVTPWARFLIDKNPSSSSKQIKPRLLNTWNETRIRKKKSFFSGERWISILTHYFVVRAKWPLLAHQYLLV